MIGEKIKAIRMEKKITAKELAERVEVTPGYISQIERDLISPSLSVLMRIADAIETPAVAGGAGAGDGGQKRQADEDTIRRHQYRI